MAERTFTLAELGPVELGRTDHGPVTLVVPVSTDAAAFLVQVEVCAGCSFPHRDEYVRASECALEGFGREGGD